MIESHSKNMPLKIFLADLTHNTQAVTSPIMPLGIGLVASYALQKFGERIEVRLFKYPEKLYEALQQEKCDILESRFKPENCEQECRDDYSIESAVRKMASVRKTHLEGMVMCLRCYIERRSRTAPEVQIPTVNSPRKLGSQHSNEEDFLAIGSVYES